ncbi:MAG: hypothetical protein PF485_02695 [Bacteroidales bacterium]|jgi:hypothetical protein|nr:hypothetical protein [Bacteroidales bacterium]
MHDNQYKFKEGENHQFKVVGFTEIPGTEESFFILENRFGGKHLLKAISYTHYDLQIGKEINCKIDKINCSGKIYLEPENPIYKEGDICNFEFIKIIDQLNSVGEKEKAALVKDQFDIEIACSLPKSISQNQKLKTIKCEVLRIKKGQLFLALPESKESIISLEIGKKYIFILDEIKELEEKIEYYIFKDQYNSSYSLKKELYEHYGLKIGQEVECTVTKYNTDGHLKIEPVHPFYEIGKTYSFKYLQTIFETNPLGKVENVIIVEDIYGIETKVRSSNEVILTNPISKNISCKVDGIRKGKAILSLK